MSGTEEVFQDVDEPSNNAFHPPARLAFARPPAGECERPAHRESAQSLKRFVCRRQVWTRTNSMRIITSITVCVLLLAVGILTVPPAGEAQQGATVPRIGFLSSSSLSDPRTPRHLGAFREGLRELGYVEGQNIAIEFRWAEGNYDRLPGLAAELVSLKVDIIVATALPAIQAAKQATGTIPIVMATSLDPVSTGFVTSLARPDLPVERPTRLELVINLRTAKALGVTIPASLLLQADQVIE